MYQYQGQITILYLILILKTFSISVPIASVFGLQGMTGVLPCEVSRDGQSHHDVTLILWFKDNATKPMYR